MMEAELWNSEDPGPKEDQLGLEATNFSFTPSELQDLHPVDLELTTKYIGAAQKLSDLCALSCDISKAEELIFKRTAEITRNEFGLVIFASKTKFDGYEKVRADLQKAIPLLVEHGVSRFISGGGGYAMEDVNRLADRYGADSIEVSIDLAVEQKRLAPGDHDDYESTVLKAHSLAPRVLLMFSMADAAISLSGGFGSLKEIVDGVQIEQLERLKTGEIFHPRAFTGIDVQRNVYACRAPFGPLNRLTHSMMHMGTINSGDDEILKFFNSPLELVDPISKNIEAWKIAKTKADARISDNSSS